MTISITVYLQDKKYRGHIDSEDIDCETIDEVKSKVNAKLDEYSKKHEGE